MNQFQSFGEVFSAIRRRLWIILLIGFVGSILSLWNALIQPRLYEATAVVQIEDARVPDPIPGTGTGASDSARRVQLIEQRLMARDNLVRIMEKHDLFADDPEMTMNERVYRMRQAARIEEIAPRANPYAPGANTPSGLLITVRLGDAQKAADLANELMYSVIDQSRSRSVGRARDTLEFFLGEELRVSNDMAQLEATIAIYKRDNASRLPAGVDSLRDELGRLREAQLDLDTEILTIESAALRQREDVTNSQIALLSEQKQLVTARIAEIESQIADAPEAERELSAMERKLTQLQEQYTVVTRRKAEAEMGQILEDREATDRFEVLETALVPEAPVSRSRKQTALLGGVASLFIGIAVAFLVELVNPAIRTAGQLERMLGLQAVVAVPEVMTAGDRRRRNATALAMLLAPVALLMGLLQLIGDQPAVADLLGRYLPGFPKG